MPLYEYQCDQHGRFEAFAPMSQSSAPSTCPGCGSVGKRAISAPILRSMDRGKMAAMDRNEKSKHAPHVCNSGCNHGPQKKSPPKDPEAKPAFQQYKGARPWVVEHA